MSETKEKKPFYKKKWFIILAILLLIGVVSSFGNSGEKDGKKTNETSNSTVETEKSNDDATKTEDEDKEIIGKVGQPISIGDIKYKVKSVRTSASVGSSMIGSSTAKGKYIIIDLSIKNNGKEPLSVTSLFFKLKLNDKEFETDSTAEIYLDNAMIFDTLNPDSTMSGTIVFDVSQKIADSSDLLLQIQTGAWGTETGLIKLK